MRLFNNVPEKLPAEMVDVLAQSDQVRVERIVSTGHSSPEGFWYDQEEHEWVAVLQGHARLTFEDETIDLEVGDWVNIPAGKKHRVEATSATEPTIWLAVFYR